MAGTPSAASSSRRVHGGALADRADYAVRVDKDLGYLGVLLSRPRVVAKAWEHIGAIGRRTFWDPQTVLVVGAGPIGLLAALIGVQQGAEVHVLDRSPLARNGPGQAVGRHLHTGAVADLGLRPHIVSSAPRGRAGPAGDGDGLVGRHRLLTGVGSPTATGTLSTATLATDVAQEHRRVRFGERQPAALLPRAKVLAAAERSWLEQLVTRRVRPDEAQQALQRAPDDIKVVMEFAQP